MALDQSALLEVLEELKVAEVGDRVRPAAETTLLCLSSGERSGQRRRRLSEGAVVLARDVALDAASDFAGTLAFGGAARDVGRCEGSCGCAFSAMVCKARFRARSPPRLSRWRMVRPLLAGSGLAPAKAAKAAS